VGKTTLLREEQRGLYGEWRLDDPLARSDVDIAAIAYKVADGQLGGLSVSFTPGTTDDSYRNGVRVASRTRVLTVDHVALVPVGAYPAVEPLAVRAPSARPTINAWREWRDGLTLPT
jgi:phage head maturation protease